jgi:predicted DsbA family dithiol-disulfide isomerase
VDPLAVFVYSDFLCPWCFNASLRLQQLQDEFKDAVCVTWRSYLLRPEPRPGRDLEKFRAYTRSWERPAADEPNARFRPWQGDAGPPSHSVPAHVAAKAAATLGRDAERALRDRLFPAYFSESRDISDAQTLRALWVEAGLPVAEFARIGEPELERQVRAEHAEALALDATGVPAVRVGENEFVLLGAQPLETYRRWLRRSLDARAGTGA